MMQILYKSAIIRIMILVTSLVNISNGLIACTDSKETTSLAGALSITAILCTDDNMIYLDIYYNTWNGDWFGIVLGSSTMIGSALVYTTGKSSNTRTLGLYAYTNTHKALDGVIYSPSNDCTDVYINQTDGYLQIVCQKPLANTDWTLDTQYISFAYAIGSGLSLSGFHSTEYQRDLVLDFTDIDTPAPKNKGCYKNDLSATTAILDPFTITLFINCDNDTVTITLAYSEYTDNWFGIVFSQNMIGNALVYTTGTSNDRTRGLYAYKNMGKAIGSVIYDSEHDWTQVSTEETDGSIKVIYNQRLNKSSTFSRETESVDIRWAVGTSLPLQYHTSRSDRFYTLYLLSGVISETVDDLTLQMVHGGIMWSAWAVMASIGIMSSAFRWLYPKGPIWFKMHYSMQCMVIVLDIIGFIIAIIFTTNNEKKHFSNNHMIIGLVVTILAILQPINALFRPHPPPNGWVNGIKPTKRVIWEIIHKTSGYASSILSCIGIFLGLKRMEKMLLAYLHIGWCGALVFVYIVLCVVTLWSSKNKMKKTSGQIYGTIPLCD